MRGPRRHRTRAASATRAILRALEGGPRAQGEPAWEDPGGRADGWHLECSAMATKT